MHSPRASLVRRFAIALAIATAASLAIPSAAEARVVRVVIDTRETIAGGASFGAAGAYERITGRVFFAFDPANAHDRQIVDLSRSAIN